MESSRHQPTGTDFAELRAAALASVRRFAGSTWTDHNAHDPGITILELLCYALTDLAYRADYSVPDLLADTASPGGVESLHPPERILTVNPVTLDDWRKLVLDVEGVRNAWIEPVANPPPPLAHDPGDNTLYFDPGAAGGARGESHRRRVPLRGVYRVLVDADPHAGVADAPLRNAVDARLHAHRNLGEDFEPTVVLAPQLISIHAEIEVGDVRNHLELLAAVYVALQDHLAPRVRFHTREAMLARGGSLAAIFDGPQLDHGFIDTDEMRRATRRDGLRTSDVIAVLMAIDGVKAVHGIRLGSGTRQESWYLPLAPGQTPVLHIPGSRIRLRRGQVAWQPTDEQRQRLEPTLRPPRDSSGSSRIESDHPAPVGRDRQVGRYHSIQHDLPEAYGVGRAGLPVSASPARHAQARQLAAYLMFFDQVLASSFRQLAHARELVSVAPGFRPAYVAQLPADTPRGSEILAPSLDTTRLQNLTSEATGGGGTLPERFLSHLLARVAEDFQDLAMAGSKHEADGSGQPTALSLDAPRLEAQRAFLRDYPSVSGGRARGFDYRRPSWGEDHAGNVSGLERRVAHKIGLARYARRPLSELTEDDPGGFHLIEHILLRPGKADHDQWPAQGDAGWRPPVFLASPNQTDPYSAQLTFVFPDWIRAFEARDSAGQPGPFARFIEKTVREETPAHLAARVLWVDRPTMAAFEHAYRAWLEANAGIS